MTIAKIFIVSFIGQIFDIVIIIAWIIILRKHMKWYVWSGLIAVVIDFILTFAKGILYAFSRYYGENIITISIYLSILDVILGVIFAISFLLVAKHLVLKSNRQKVPVNKGLQENISNKEMEQD